MHFIGLWINCGLSSQIDTPLAYSWTLMACHFLRAKVLSFGQHLACCKGTVKKTVIIGLFCGETKPKSLSEYLQHLLNELKTLSGGFVFKGRAFIMNVSSVMCDAPARAFITAVKLHTAYHGCDKCHQTGVRIGSQMTFPEVCARHRTGKYFRQAIDEEHHRERSPFSDLDIDMVTTFPHDYMHLVCLGVTRRLIHLWMGPPGPLCCHMSSNQASLISERLLASKEYIPSEFARRPCPLADINRWKATELRQFLLCTGPIYIYIYIYLYIYINKIHPQCL